jgi:CheY-like chemotaxis protein
MPHVLVVDDNHGIRRTLRWVLELAVDGVEYVVAEAADGQKALDKLRASRDPAVVLFDLYMPVMDGQQMLEHILADPALSARCALICMTASVISFSPNLAALLETHDIPAPR